MSKEKEGGIIAEQIFKRIAALNSDQGPVLCRSSRPLPGLLSLIYSLILCSVHLIP